MNQTSFLNQAAEAKHPYIRPCAEVIKLGLRGALNDAYVSAVNINGFDKGEVPDITVDDGDDDEPANAKSSKWSDEETNIWE